MSTTTATTPSEDLLAGITPKTTKAELIDRLTKATGIIRDQHVQQSAKLREIEERVRAKFADRQWNGSDLLQIIVQGTEPELKDAVEFMGDLEDVLPPTLTRLLLGARTLLNEDVTTAEVS